MKYLILIYSDPVNWAHPIFARHPAYLDLPPREREEIERRAQELFAEITESGELVAGAALADPAATRTARAPGGVPAVTDGPYLEAKEHLAGYFVVECASRERAEEIAGRFPDARFGAVEVRLITDTAEGGA
ncbi:YciI family protein [Spongiactinospora rosea]|uniref:YciI family protein n=1 Tax=Spongiactinospora rosea TaxID=2248750 RepID=A0A366LWA2_9ACTN|nr:YciI family protein [Spongiactinospora rosea]RBQ18228.1 YciI family protein [Spongiactinospora rosea]